MREVFIPGTGSFIFHLRKRANTGSDYLRLVSIIKRCLPFEGVRLRERCTS